MKVNKSVYTCDYCKKEFKEGFTFYGKVNEILSGNEKGTVVNIDFQTTETHICSSCISQILGLA